VCTMLEPTAIHSYEPPWYRVHPPSPVDGPPASLPFACVILESANGPGGPSPMLLHSLRQQGCQLILAQFEEDSAKESQNNAGHRTGHSAALSREWFDAVFDKVIQVSAEERSGHLPLERYLTDEGIPPVQALCFACSAAGARTFAAVQVGLIISPEHDKV